MATSVASPLEKHLGMIANVTEMTSRSQVGQTQITLQFGLDRNIDGAARDVQAAINAARVDLPVTLRSNPTYRKFNPADSPIMILALTSKTRTPGQIYDVAASVLQQQLLQVKGVGDVNVGGSSLPAVRVDVNPLALGRYGIGLEDVRAALASANANQPKGVLDDGALRFQVYANDSGTKASDYAPLVIAVRNGATVRLRDIATITEWCRGRAQPRPGQRQAGGCAGADPPARRQHHRHGRSGEGLVADLEKRAAAGYRPAGRGGPDHHHPRFAGRRGAHGGDRGAAGGRGDGLLPAQRPRRADPSPSRSRCRCWARWAMMFLLHFSLDNLSLMALTVATGSWSTTRSSSWRTSRATSKRAWAGSKPPCSARAKWAFTVSFDQHLAGGGVHPDPADGRIDRPPVP